MRKWVVGVLGAVVGSLIVAWVTGAWNPVRQFQSLFPGGSERAEQAAYAEEIARKYFFFSTGEEPWSNPRVVGYPNRFQAQGDIVTDAASGVAWQRSGSADSIPFAETDGYLRSLNQQRFGGHADWRLPTLAEAWSLLEQRQERGLHIDPVFDARQTWIWTDRATGDGYGWFIQFERGRPIFQNYWQSHAYVRAVRGPKFQ